MNFNCIIVDDDINVIEQLTEYVAQLPELKLVNSFTDPKLALKEIALSQKKIDILLTDIEMPELNGLELAGKIRHKINFLVLVSGHINYAIDGYDVRANGFLSKPFDSKKFKSTLTPLINQSLENACIFIKTKGEKKIVKVLLEEILYIEAAGNYVNIHTKNGILITLLKLSDIEEKLRNNSSFIRIHKSFIVSVLNIEKYQSGFVFLTNKKSLSVTSTYKDNLINFFG